MHAFSAFPLHVHPNIPRKIHFSLHIHPYCTTSPHPNALPYRTTHNKKGPPKRAIFQLKKHMVRRSPNTQLFNLYKYTPFSRPSQYPDAANQMPANTTHLPLQEPSKHNHQTATGHPDSVTNHNSTGSPSPTRQAITPITYHYSPLLPEALTESPPLPTEAGLSPTLLPEAGIFLKSENLKNFLRPDFKNFVCVKKIEKPPQ